jgi:hypothetical protein
MDGNLYLLNTAIDQLTQLHPIGLIFLHFFLHFSLSDRADKTARRSDQSQNPDKRQASHGAIAEEKRLVFPKSSV